MAPGPDPGQDRGDRDRHRPLLGCSARDGGWRVRPGGRRTAAAPAGQAAGPAGGPAAARLRGSGGGCCRAARLGRRLLTRRADRTAAGPAAAAAAAGRIPRRAGPASATRKRRPPGRLLGRLRRPTGGQRTARRPGARPAYQSRAGCDHSRKAATARSNGISPATGTVSRSSAGDHREPDPRAAVALQDEDREHQPHRGERAADERERAHQVDDLRGVDAQRAARAARRGTRRPLPRRRRAQPAEGVEEADDQHQAARSPTSPRPS